jgi:hypothetical protein
LVPVKLTVAQMLKIAKLPVQVALAARYWVDTPDNGPDGWGGRFSFTFLFPK